MNFHIAKLFIWVIPWLNKVIECSIHECSLNDKDNDISYYLIYLGPFFIGQFFFVSTIPMICYHNGNILRTEADVKYAGNKVIIMPLDAPIDYMFEQLGDMIYSRTTIDKQRFKLVLNCKYPLKSGNRFQPFPIWYDNSVY